jgi:hypothetical protein
MDTEIIILLAVLLMGALPAFGIAYVTRRKLTKAENRRAKMISVIVFIAMHLITLAAYFMLVVQYHIQVER